MNIIEKLNKKFLLFFVSYQNNIYKIKDKIMFNQIKLQLLKTTIKM